jgi:hypothetical protein
MANGRICAYCGSSGNITAEHIWPKWLVKEFSYGISYSIGAKKTFRGEMRIKDVCATCNNGPLSTLDSYLLKLYQNYFTRQNVKNRPVIFNYDFGLLTRSLMKISFNSSRGGGFDPELLAEYADTLLARHPTSPIQVAIFVDIAKSAKWRDPETGKLKEIKPKGFRSGALQIPELLANYDHWSALRAIVINGYRFMILVMKEPVVLPDLFFLLRDALPGVPLLPSGRITIPRPKANTFDFFDGIQHWPDIDKKFEK